MLGNFMLLFYQGSVVVFGSYEAWSDLDLDTKDPNYCSIYPMRFAFILLIVIWVCIYNI